MDIGTPVAATDVDGDTLTYTLGGTDASAFSIASTSGQLRTSAALDYETKTSYSVTITVSDGNGGTDSINVVINITNIDETPSNNEPVFSEGSSTSRSVLENTGSGLDIGSAVSATDADGDTLNYTLGGTDAAAFSIDSFLGQLRTSSALDYEEQNSYSVVITASDGSLTSSINVTIDVIDANEAPIFTVGSSTSRIVPENAAIGANIGTAVSATDEDGDNLTYSLGGTDAAAFGIDNTTGQLQTNVALNTSTKTTYSVTITASDGSLTDSISVTINVRSVNDAPVFTERNSATRSIPENTAANTNIGTAVSATDADGDTITYTLSGTDAAAFGINNTNGQLRTNAALNFETKAAYLITVTASDGNLTDNIAITINVTDANDAPVFTGGTSTTRSIAENTGAAINIGTAISASDEDDDTLTYTLGGTDAASFDISSTNGQLQTKTALDFEDKNTYSVTVAVSDGNNGTDSISVTINVTDLEETPANNPPVFTDGTGATRSIAENTAADTNIGTPVAATDADNNTLAYTLSGTDAASFGIDSTTGQLKTNASLDHETKDEYSVTVNVNDGSTSVSITVTINVTDANDAPVFTDGTSATRTIAENTASDTNIGTAIPATDQDRDDLTYTLGGTDSASFSIVSASGQLQTSAALNYENRSSYAVTITVSDGSLTDTIDVTINITDANDAPTFTDGASTTRSVAENTDSGTNIGTAVSATDPDTDDTLTYTLGGTDAESFSIVSTSGQLQTKAALDYETKTSYSVTISVSDGNDGSDSIDVTISVTDINENRAPVFTDGTSTTRSVAENTTSGTNIGSAVAATDPDTDDTLTYTLSGTDATSFSIVSTSGQLQTKASLDYETKTSYSVTISVSDGNGGSDSITVTVNVTDVDENRAPSFTDGSSTTRSVAENTGSGNDIGSTVGATDPDNDTLTYTLGGDDAASFSINSTDGQLRTKAALDYETKTSYSVTITVSDSKLTDSIDVTINVTDVDENRAPSFTDGSSTTRSVAENTGSGNDIGSTVGATDPDNDTLTYTLGGDDAASFSINSTNGQLRTSTALDYETKTSYSVTIAVSDSKLTDSITVTVNVSNVNEAPTFTDGSSTTRSIAENTASSQNIGTAVAATDPDSGTTLTYSLSGTDASSFSIVSTSGQLQTSTALDYETKTSYSVTVSVSDGSLTDSITVTINVTNVNEKPTFASGASISNISATEDTAITSVILPAATDPDANTTITYTLTPALPAGLTFTASTRALAGTPTAEKASTTYTYKASDGTLSSTLTFTIQVVAAPSNNAPVFTDGTSTTRSVAENTAAGINIGTAVGATDADTDDTLTYSLSGTDASSFSIVSTSGQLQTKASLDYETKTSYSVTVSVSDGNGGSDSITVTINITDVNENITPVSERTSQVRDAIVAAIDGVDSADDVTAAHLAAITSLSLSQKSITSLKSGDFDGLTALTTLDLSRNNLRSLPSGIFDELTELTTLNLWENKFRNLPATLPSGIFDELTKLGSLSLPFMLRSLPSGIFDKLTELRSLSLGGTLMTSLPSGIFDELTKLTTLNLPNNYLMTSLPSGIFDELTALENLHIHPGLTSLPSGIFDELTALTRLDFPFCKVTSLPSGIFDELTALDWLDFRDNDINDISDLEDLTTLTYLSLSGNPISDYGPLRRLKTAKPSIYIDINLDNNIPTFTDGDSTTRSVAENTAAGQNIGTAVAATDADTTNTLTYSLGGTDMDSFDIVSTSGQLQTKAALDYETKNSYSVTITVYDGNSGGDRITVTINVTDVNEGGTNNAPVFTDGTSTTRSVAENTTSGQNIGTAVAATDSDSDTLTYTLSGTDEASFSIVSTSGQLQTKAALDYETKTSYSVTVSVSDGNGGSDSITVTINVTDVTETPANNDPVFTDGTSTTRSVAENTTSGQNIGTAVAATDSDSDTLTYTLGGTDEASFSIVSTSGQLQTKGALDYETKTSYSVTVSVSDGNGGSDSITVTINVTDVSETNSAPTFTDGDSTTRSVAEGTATGQDIGTAVGATDTDTSDTLTYTLGGTDSASFSIVSTSGQLQTKAALDYETKNAYSVTVSVADGNSGTDSIDVTINVTDIDEVGNDPPTFTDGSSTTRSVAENTAADTDIGDAVAATDSDSDDTLTYTLGGTDSGSFSIVSTSGQLQTKAALDYETKTSYSVTVSVSDGNSGSDSIDVTINVTDVSEGTTYTVGDDIDTLPTGFWIPDKLSGASFTSEGGNITITFNDDGYLEEGDITYTCDNATGCTIVNGEVTQGTIEATTTTNNGAPAGTLPPKSALLPNFPNPFNPETWIPYQLAKDADVTLTIYDMRGVVVRELKLGHQAAGVYTSRSRAIHWDGRNHFGEKVATGLYFYTLKADDFTATRKMLIQK